MIIAEMVVSGLGFGLLMPNVNVWTVSLVSLSIRGKAVGGLATLHSFTPRQTGYKIFPDHAGMLFSGRQTSPKLILSW